jgi:hypothetical protein
LIHWYCDIQASIWMMILFKILMKIVSIL